MSIEVISTLPMRRKGNALDKAQKIPLTTNLFKVKFQPQVEVHIYAFTLSPNIDKDNRAKLLSLVESNRSTLEPLIGSFLHSGRTLFGTKLFGVKGDVRKVRLAMKGESFELSLKPVKSMLLSDVYSPEKRTSGVILSFFNNIIKTFFNRLNFTEIGRSRKYFDTSSKKSLDSAGVMVFSGFATSFNVLETGLYLRVDPSCKIVREESVLDVINQVYKRHGDKSKGEKRLVIQEELVGKMVMANYGRSKYYVIEEVLFEVGLNHAFTDNQQQVSLEDYYKNVYDIQIQNKKQPLLRATTGSSQKNSKRPQIEIILVPELCLMSGLPDNFDERKRREVSGFTIVKPAVKLREIEDFMKNLNSKLNSGFCPSTLQENLGIDISPTLTKVTSKLLPAPVLQLGGRERVDSNKAAGFMLFNKPLFASQVPLRLLIVGPEDFDYQPLKTLLVSTCHNLNLELALKIQTVRGGNSRNFIPSVQEAISSEREKSNCYWVVLSPSFKNEYKTLKSFLLGAKVSKISQISLTSTLNKKGFNSILTKILLQMAAKVGNKLWVPKVSDEVEQTGILMIGIDTYKHSERRGKSVLAFCSTTDPSLSEFYSNYYLVDSSDAIAAQLRRIVIESINQYILVNKQPPQELVVLKNCSSRLELGTVLDSEVHEIKEALKSIPKNYRSVSVSYIVVDKNVSQKFFFDNKGQVSNPLYGTLVSTEVVSKWYDFYIIAQNCNLGTAKPVYFKVMFSNSEMEEGVLQELLYGQCFNYMNWSGSVRVPSVLQYAKKLSMFAAQYLGEPLEAEEIREHLYYI